MKIYVASAYEDWRRTRAVMATLVSLGHEITHDWTAGAELRPKGDAAVPVAERRAIAYAALGGVHSADLVMLMTPGDRTLGAGCWLEMGAALADQTPVVVAGPQCRRSVFCDLAMAQCAFDDDAIAFVHAYAERTDEIDSERSHALAGVAT